MAIIKCKMCGGNLNLAPNASTAECEYCGSMQTLPRISDERLSNFYERANDFRMSHEFDKATEIYEKIIEENPADADAYWSMVLCHYGIDYVEETKGGSRKPTINRAQMVSVFEDINYRSAIKYADAAQKRIYEEEAAKIDRILQRYLEISRNEPAYDVFICYKETAADGKRTEDSVHAAEIYRKLTSEGFKVFFAPVTLENKLGEDYEPYIFAAIHSAKVMVVIGTRPEYMTAVWVKNEWSRFLTLAKEDSSKTLIPVYANMSAYEMPEAFRFKQAQDMNNLGFMLDLLRGIEKLVGKNIPGNTPQSASYEKAGAPAANIDTLLQRAAIFLEDQDWNSANIYCEKVLDVVPTNSTAYLYKLLAEARVSSEDSLQYFHTPLDKMKAYKNAVRYANESTSSKLIKWNQTIKDRLDKEEAERRERHAREEAERKERERIRRENERLAAEFRQKKQTIADAVSNASSVVASQVREKELTQSRLNASIDKMANLKKYKRKILIPSLLILVNTIILASTLSNGSALLFYIIQFPLAMALAGARGRSKAKAFFQTLLTIGFFPFFSAIKGMGEATKASVSELLKEQTSLRSEIQRLETEITSSRGALSELNGRMAALNAQGVPTYAPDRAETSGTAIEDYIRANFTSANKLSAIKYYKDQTGADLRQAKDVIDSLLGDGTNT